MRNKWETKLPSSGYKVYVYEEQTNRPAKVYTQEEGGSAITNLPQLESDQEGKVKFWVDTLDYDVDKRFRILITDPLGKPLVDLPRVDIFDAKKFFERAFVVDQDFPTLDDAISYAVTNNKTLVISKEWNVTANATINADLFVLKGGMSNISSGVTLTINGSFMAGLYQVFDGDGIAVFGSGAVLEVYPEWWGAKGDGTTDDVLAIQRVIDCAVLSGVRTVCLTARQYSISKPIEVPAITEWSGGFKLYSKNITEIIKTSDDVGSGSNLMYGGSLTDSYDKNAILIIKHDDNAFSYYVTISGLILRKLDSAPGSYGIYAPRISHCRFENIAIRNCQYGFVVHDAWMCELFRVQAQGDTSLNPTYGFWWDANNSNGTSGTSCTFIGCWARDVRYGYRFEGLSYSNLISCGADHIGVYNEEGGIPYWFSTCHSVTMEGCGCEDVTVENLKALIYAENTWGTINGFRAWSIRKASGADEAYPIFTNGNGRLFVSGTDIDDWEAEAEGHRFPIASFPGRITYMNCRLPSNGNTFEGTGTIFQADAGSSNKAITLCFNDVADDDTCIARLTVPNGKTLVIRHLTRYSMTTNGNTQSNASVYVNRDPTGDNETVINSFGNGYVPILTWTNDTGSDQVVVIRTNNGGNTGYIAFVRGYVYVE